MIIINIFLSGPITNNPKADEEFQAYENIVRSIVGPQEENEIFNPTKKIPKDVTHEEAMLIALGDLTCNKFGTRKPYYDCVVQLPKKSIVSPGMETERIVAESIGIPVYKIDEFILRFGK